MVADTVVVTEVATEEVTEAVWVFFHMQMNINIFHKI